MIRSRPFVGHLFLYPSEWRRLNASNVCPCEYAACSHEYTLSAINIHQPGYTNLPLQLRRLASGEFMR